MNREEMAKEFIIKGKQPFNEDLSNLKLLRFRLCLLREELNEIEQEVNMIDINNNKWENTPEDIKLENKAALLKEMVDLQYVLSGMAATFNLPLEEAYRRVHESNMSKFEPCIKYREDGKILKGDGYQPPYLEDLIDG